MSSEVARVYADALFSLAKDGGDRVLQQTRSDLREMAVLLSLNPDLTRLLSLPTLSLNERQGIATTIFGAEGLPERLLLLLIDHKRVSYFGEIADHFDELMSEHQNTVDVTVTTAIPLSDDQRARMVAALQKKLQKSVRLQEHIDRSILGGAVVQCGDLRMDNSLKRRLGQISSLLHGEKNVGDQ